MKYLLKIPGALMLFVLMALTLSCAKDSYFDIDSPGKEGTPYTPGTKGRISPVINRNVMIMISGGRNSLAGYLSEDLRELENSSIPEGNYVSGNVLIVFSRNGYNKNVAAPAALYRVYRDRNDNVVRDTLKTWGDFTPMFGENTMAQALKIVVDEFPGSNYGIVLSSHGTGYLPDGYYSDPNVYESNNPIVKPYSSSLLKNRTRISQEVFEPIPEYPAVKSIGQDWDSTTSVEMELKAFHDAIPCHMDYILLDACLMAGVEVAYELRDKADIIGFSPTEILADGFNYKQIASRLVVEEPDPVQVCRDYYDQYRILPEGSEVRCATISAVDTRYIEELATVCRALFEKYREEIATVDADNIQRYFRLNRHFFYDIKDILVKSGASKEDLSELDAALQKTVIYKAHTPYFLSIPIGEDTYSGLSMYLPKMGSPILDKFYRENISWNSATELVK